MAMTEEEARIYRAEWQRQNKDKRNASAAKWRAANPEKIREGRVARKDAHNDYRRKWRSERKLIGLDTDAAWRIANPDKLKQYKKTYGALHPERNLEMNARRRAAKKNALPGWESKKYIALFYRLARQDTITNGLKMVVDHIVPLRSKYVCGLHCEDNLQVLTKTANEKKNNKWWPDMWD